MKFDAVLSAERGLTTLEELVNVRSTTKVKSVNPRLVSPTGQVISEYTNILVPESWSVLAASTLTNKYLRKNGLPDAVVTVEEEGIPVWLRASKPHESASTQNMEKDARDVFHRLSGAITYWGWKEGVFDSELDAAKFYAELYLVLETQTAAFNSPQWFNTGLNWAYGITGPPQGHWRVHEELGESEARKTEDAYTYPQPHACFIQSVQDDLVGPDGILSLFFREARLFKYGSGTGSNFSTIRAKNEPLSGGGQSSGLMSFLKIGDSGAGAIKSGGTTRRAAKMVCLDMDHPEIEDFVMWKVREEEKVAALAVGSNKIVSFEKDLFMELDKSSGEVAEAVVRVIQRALDDGIPETFIRRSLKRYEETDREDLINVIGVDWQSEGYATVSGQNANNSVRPTNEFFECVQKDLPWSLTARTTGQEMCSVPAKDLFAKACYAAWACADPGFQYDSTINEWNTCSADGKICGSNPCSEYMFLDDTACNLASHNLVKYYKEGEFCVDLFIHVNEVLTTALEISVFMAQYPSEAIAQRSYLYRTLGIGYANLGSLLMRAGIPYAARRGQALCASITSLMTGSSYLVSAKLAKELGPFKRYQANKEEVLRVLHNHAVASSTRGGDYHGLSIKPLKLNEFAVTDQFSNVRDAASSVWKRALDEAEKHGVRNAQVSVLAPTGTISLVMDCDTTGVEPDFALIKAKKLAGGGYINIVNEAVPQALENLGYTRAEIEEMLVYLAGTKTLRGSTPINWNSLSERGLSVVNERAIEEALSQSSFGFFEAFNQETIPRESWEEYFEEQAHFFSKLGFTKEQLESTKREVFGHHTLEGCKVLKEEHLPIFTCAQRCGDGKAFLSADAHLEMMAAAQPYLSGAISKTVNLPAESTVKDVERVFLKGWQLGLKAVAIYRDKSKLSQPLSAGFQEVFNFRKLREPAKRSPLPNKRKGYGRKLSIGGFNLYLRTGEYENGDLGEIFIDMHKEGADFKILLNCFAIAVSKGLQHGVPLQEYVDTFKNVGFNPRGFVREHESIRSAQSVLDLVFRELELEYLLKEAEEEKSISVEKVESTPAEDLGEACIVCGNYSLRKSGTCYVCTECGNTTGCS